jgi:multidrug/hemolysin transport system permease protein
MIFLTTLLKSVNAFGTMSGILGTLIGFVSGIYMPLVVLGKSMAYVASLVPFTHMAIILKNVLLKGPYEELSLLVPSEAMTEISAVYGTTEIGILGSNVSMIWIMLACVVFALTLLYFAYRRLNQKMGK